ncbi:MAG: UbiA family prenyltransferase, partial [Anaerolineae bacterium]
RGNPKAGGGKESLKAYLDLTRAHFAVCWPLLFCSGLLLAFERYGSFSASLLIRAALLGLFGLEAGMVMNDYVDREIDERDVDLEGLTGYWRPFNKRPIPAGLISPRQALALFWVLVGLCLILVATLPWPNALYLLAIMPASFLLQYFYQVHKRKQRWPLAQLVGRIDVTLFPVAGYLCLGHPDSTALALFLFYYPWILAHLAVNDLADLENDRARGLKSVAVLLGTRGTALWIVAASAAQVLVSPLLLAHVGAVGQAGIVAGFGVLAAAAYVVWRGQDRAAALKALPLLHLTMALYVGLIILDYFL